ncbi:RDD family protein [Isoptericola sp. b441]|uniref:RDD family protein n=1 Tax=Actinotalea lenta TaxID=3064654 RepID=A0ABT9DF49_9CELL|nr:MULTISPECIES: RDD family protein [unclassified Isoptericola]MDO8108581.1 RDD family protein [Isoptericola sp. b441]MDO8119991.1 RDD family protein [Isoptericola sp. b490]
MSDEILIGEGVVLDARPASFASRVLAGLVDVVVLAVVGWVIVLVTFAAGQRANTAAGTALVVAVMVAIMVGIPTTVETLSRGRSLGKLALGLRIVRDDGGPVRFRHAVIRALVGVLELWMTAGSVALITSMLHRKGKRVGDLLAGTYAVRVRGGQRALPPVVMPTELAAWARSCDIRRLPDGLALSVRQFLGRSAGLNPTSRSRLGTELAAQVEQYVAPGPPLGTHPERFLAAVLAERRDREYATAARRAASAAEEERQVARLPHGVPDPY